MAAIASFTGISMQGVIHPPKRVVRQFVRDGVAGSGYTRSVAHGAVSNVVTHHLFDAVETSPGPPPVISPAVDEYKTFRDAAYALIGTIVTVVDAFGETFNNVVVQDCTVSAANAVSGSNGLHASVAWVLIAEENTGP